jgi:hypothetical protein
MGRSTKVEVEVHLLNPPVPRCGFRGVEVTDGNWGGPGRVYHVRDVAALVNGRLLPAA